MIGVVGRRDLLVGTAVASALALGGGLAGASPRRVAVPPEEHERAIAALRPRPGRDRPVVAVLAQNEGAETTDFLAPYAVLRRSGLAEVLAVAPEAGPIRLAPALRVKAQASFADFDALYAQGADYVIVPAVRDRDEERTLRWIREQAGKGAIVVGICSGVLTVSAAGLLKGRDATGYFADVEALQRRNPTMRWVRDRRYVVDRGVATTTGITASVPMSLAIVEAIGGRARMEALAAEIGASGSDAGHDSAAFHNGSDPYDGLRGLLRSAASVRYGIPVAEGVDELALAFMADAYSRVHRTRTLAIAGREEPVRMRHGLELLPDAAMAEPGADRLLASPPAERPARALDAALDDIALRYGAETAGFVAHQMEYPRGSHAH